MSKFQEDLHTCRTTLQTRLDEVTDLDALPTENEINALSQVMHGCMMLMAHLETMHDLDVATLFSRCAIEEALTRLHVEVRLLKQECESAVVTRGLLEQQILVKDKGSIVLNQLTELEKELHDLCTADFPPGSDADERNT